MYYIYNIAIYLGGVSKEICLPPIPPHPRIIGEKALLTLVRYLKAMDEHGCDCLLDIHGDEGITAGPILCCAPAWTPRLANLQTQLHSAVSAVNKDFSVEGSTPHLLYTLHGASNDSDCGNRMDNMQAAGANLTLCSTQVGHRFDCLAATLEMIFKDIDTRLAPYYSQPRFALLHDPTTLYSRVVGSTPAMP